MHWQADDPFRRCLGDWKIALAMAEMDESRLQMKRFGIVNGGRNSTKFHFLLEFVPILDFNGVLRVDAGVSAAGYAEF